ncbi:hypothetical protein GE061_002196 [Apolygus lucorum]|uniref:DUF7041 domain-containing protein n=1 Tax=Apolygus lucorum TaxID=248454 RepID=A0A6A4JEW8_APOLU|nr:hypothetical protein GE061_002196 [Apolygus lucorum]
MAQEQTIESLATGSARLPAFHANDPHLWFIQIEAQFAAERVTTETTKFNRVVSQLPIDVLQQITDLVETPGTSPYTQLKTRLSSLYTDSQEDQLLALLHDTPIGDQKPSLALNRLRYIAGKDTPLAIVKTIWIKRLPTSIQQNLMTAGESDINKLAALADRLIALERPSVAALNTSTDLSTLKDQDVLPTNFELFPVPVLPHRRWNPAKLSVSPPPKITLSERYMAAYNQEYQIPDGESRALYTPTPTTESGMKKPVRIAFSIFDPIPSENEENEPPTDVQPGKIRKQRSKRAHRAIKPYKKKFLKSKKESATNTIEQPLHNLTLSSTNQPST